MTFFIVDLTVLWMCGFVFKMLILVTSMPFVSTPDGGDKQHSTYLFTLYINLLVKLSKLEQKQLNFYFIWTIRDII